MDRRKFVTVLGASTVLPAFSSLRGKPASGHPENPIRSRSRIGLNGPWERYIDGVLYDVIPVPSSQRPIGSYELRREFLLPKLGGGERVVLRFEGITYYGEVAVNGRKLGTMDPYVPYEFEFTKEAKEGTNRVEVRIVDLAPGPKGEGKDEVELGLNPGWEAYGGIIREVYAEVRPATCIENVRLGYELSKGYRRAECEVRVYVSSVEARKARIEVVVEQGPSEVGRGEREVEVEEGKSEVVVKLAVDSPALWSPEEPNLYELKVRLESGGVEDEWRTRTGFREVKIVGNEFWLNGKGVVLKGVCRHDMWKGQGFTLTAGQMDQDMRMIKQLGCNFVRLVHYPHHRRVVELADELGLLVSEEPGYWGMDFTTMRKGMIDLGYRIMERTIRRDWNSPSVFAWLLGNECRLTVEYLREGKARCRKLDPLSRPVSFANDMSMEKAKPIFEQAGLDFFDQHVYPPDPNAYRKVAEFYAGSLPLTFTEWGWEVARDGTISPETHAELLRDLTEKKLLAGHMFWSWQDIREYSRMDSTTVNGILLSGVVTESRDVRASWQQELGSLFRGERKMAEPATAHPTVLPLRRLPAAPRSSFQEVDLQSLVEGQQGKKAWGDFESRMAKFWAESRMARDQWKRTGEKFLLWPKTDLKIGGIPFLVPAMDGYARPLMLTPEAPEATVPIGRDCVRLHILGQVTFPSGFPVAGRPGDLAATYHLRFAEGREVELPVRNGIEVAQANQIFEATRINPVATAAQPALEFVKDTAREHYRILLWTIPLAGSRLKSLRFTLHGGHPPLAIFAITSEQKSPQPGS